MLGFKTFLGSKKTRTEGNRRCLPETISVLYFDSLAYPFVGPLNKNEWRKIRKICFYFEMKRQVEISLHPMG